ncbi:MAG: hypothetical protein K940chlam3_00424 [Chlamydiae bacterium]|nr:hypothetical protein [Chlamydiota bacterium]
MRVEGKLIKSTKFWIADIPMFDLCIQGKTKKETLYTVKEAVKDLVEVSFESLIPDNFEVFVESSGKLNDFSVSFSDVQVMTAFVLKRQREKHGLSVREVVKRLGAKSTNAYFDYERLRRKPTIAKFELMLHAINPNRNIYLR